MQFEYAYGQWRSHRIIQKEVANLPGTCSRTLRCYVNRYEEAGLDWRG